MRTISMTTRIATTIAAAAVLAAGAGAASPAVARSGSDASASSSATGDRTPIFDFTDDFYRSHGIDPAKLVGRRSGTDGISVPDESPDNSHRDVRVTFTLPAYDTSGGRHFFTVLSDLAPQPFTSNTAGTAARQLAEASPVYVFPTRTGDPLDAAAGRQALAELKRKNGASLDGTPIIRTEPELVALTRNGYAKQTKRPVTQQGRYFICPVFKDPRDGAIAPDAFLATVRRPDGTPLPAERGFVSDFESLQDTGDFAG